MALQSVGDPSKISAINISFCSEASVSGISQRLATRLGLKTIGFTYTTNVGGLAKVAFCEKIRCIKLDDCEKHVEIQPIIVPDDLADCEAYLAMDWRDTSTCSIALKSTGGGTDITPGPACRLDGNGEERIFKYNEALVQTLPVTTDEWIEINTHGSSAVARVVLNKGQKKLMVQYVDGPRVYEYDLGAASSVFVNSAVFNILLDKFELFHAHYAEGEGEGKLTLGQAIAEIRKYCPEPRVCNPPGQKKRKGQRTWPESPVVVPLRRW